MKRVIKIFLASSITEFRIERMEIENFIRNVSDKFEEHYDIKIKPVLCENLDDAYTVARKQEEYNEKIRESEFCFFLFFTKVGQYTREEFEVARKRFEETGKPKIYTYFKIIKDETVEESLGAFMEELDKTFGHYYGQFEHIDTVKLRMLLNLKLQEMDFIEIKAEGGKCVVDGVPVMPLDNVVEFVNNKQLAAMQKELKEVEEEYYRLKPQYANGGCDNEFYSKYSKIASRRQALIDEIEELQGLIFKMSLRMSTDEVRGEITARQKEAYRLFELGDYEGCMTVLDSNEIDDEFEREEKLDAERRVARRRKYIREYKTKIEILSVMSGYADRFREITECYEKIVPYALTEKIELDVVYEYTWFLYEQNKDSEKTVKLLERLETIYTELGNTEAKISWIYGVLALIYSRNPNEFKKAEKYHYQVIEIREKKTTENPELFNIIELVDSYNNAAVFFCEQGKRQEAKKYYLKVIKMYEQLASKNPDGFNPNLASVYDNMGVLCSRWNDSPQRTEEYFLKAIAIREKLVAENPDRFNPDLARSYNNAGLFYSHQGQRQKAEEYYLKAIRIYDSLAARNPERFNPDLAGICHNFGAYYRQCGQLKIAEGYYAKAIAIREKLVVENPDRFYPDLAGSYNSAGLLYFGLGQVGKAEKYYLKAILIYESIVEEGVERFISDLAMSYNNVGNFYADQGQPQKAEEYYLKAIAIRETLVLKDSQCFYPALAESYFDAGLFYAGQGQIKTAEEYYLKVIAIREVLVSKNPNRFTRDLAVTYFNLAVLKGNNRWWFKKAYDLSLTHPDHPDCRQIVKLLSQHF